MAQQGTGTPQDPIKTKLYFQKKGLVYEVGGGGGGSGGSTQYIKTPVILSPVNEATGVSVLATIRVSEYENLFESDAWANRHVQIATVGEFTAESIVYDHMEKATEFQVTEPPLPANTTLYIRAKDYSEDGLESEWSNIVMFTTGDAITVNKPELQLFGWHESTSDFVQTVKATASEFSVTQGQIDNHIKTDWWIEQATTRSNVHIWESMGDTTNLTSITTPEVEALQPSTKYVFCCVYYGEKFGASPVSMKEFTTSDDFGKVNTPTLSVEGGPSDVYETPTLTGTAFSNTRDPDTHISTDWKIVLASDAGASAVWESTSDVANLTTITVPKGKLQTGTSYIAMVRYRGQVYGVSEWAQYQFSTVAAFSSINTPTLTVDGAPSSVLETPTLTLSAFGGDNATHKNTHFKVLLNSDNSEVWSTTVAAPAVSVKVPAKTLQANTTYKFQGWYEAVEGVTSAVAEVVATTKQTFVEIGDIGKPDSPTFGVGIPSDEVAESFIPGIQKHPDFYDETKPGYGTWVVPETLIKNTTKWDGAFKFIPKFYWMPLFNGDGGTDNVKTNEELQAILPYVDVTLEQMNESKYKYPFSAIVIAKAGAFKNEADANAHGFILPAAFIDGGKEKDGFFISSTLTSRSIEEESGNRIVTVHLGENYVSTAYDGTPLWRLTSLQDFGDRNQTKQDLSLSDNLYDAIRISKACNENLNCESVYTVAALALLSLAIAQYSKSTEETAWYSSDGLKTFPKGINVGRNKDADDPSVIVANPIETSRGDLFPTTLEGYKKTTHNGRINGLTHVNGWLARPMVGFGSLLSPRSDYIFNPTKHSLTEITVENVDFSEDRAVYDTWSLNAGSEWSDSFTTPLYTDKTGAKRLQNCFLPKAGNSPSARFGSDYYDYRAYELMICGGGSTSNTGAGMFYRNGVNLSGQPLYWIEDYPDYGFRAVGYPLKNSDGTVGNEAFLISDDTSPFHGISVLLNPQERTPIEMVSVAGVTGSQTTYDVSVDFCVSFPSEEVMNEITVTIHPVAIQTGDYSRTQTGTFSNGQIEKKEGAVFTKRFVASSVVAVNGTPIYKLEGVYIKLKRGSDEIRHLIYEQGDDYIHSWLVLTTEIEGEVDNSWGGAISSTIGYDTPELGGTQVSIFLQEEPFVKSQTNTSHRYWYTLKKVKVVFPSEEIAEKYTVDIGAGSYPERTSTEPTGLWSPLFTIGGTEQDGSSFTYTNVTGELGERAMNINGPFLSGISVRFTPKAGGAPVLCQVMDQATVNAYRETIPI